MDALLIGNDHTLEVTGLRDEVLNTYINDADVTAEIKNQSGVVVASVTLAYVASSNGNYRGTIEDTTAILNGKFYTAEITADAGGGLVAFWRKDLLARYRGFGE